MLDCILKEFYPDNATNLALSSSIKTTITGQGSLPSCFRTTDLAAYSMLLAGQCLAQFANASGATLSKVEVDRRLASFWFDQSLYPQGWSLPPVWDDIAGNYPTIDGWIRLHTNAVNHKKAALSVLNCKSEREQVARAVKQMHAEELESAVVGAGGAAAEMRSLGSWQKHSQGQAVAKESLVAWEDHGLSSKLAVAGNPSRPLAGIKVLDLTRVIAGPVASRFLAGYGADVLRIDPIDLWDDADNAPEMTLGKRCAGLDLRKPADQPSFAELLAQADVFIHGYRPGALANLGFDEVRCRALNSQLNTVSLCAYGWSGPWAGRRGFDSVVQMSCGIAHAGMQWQSVDKPHPLPVQALDHATGYLMAAAALHALKERALSGRVLSAKLSLAKTADLLSQFPATNSAQPLKEVAEADFTRQIEPTAWGAAKRISFPVNIKGCPAAWPYPAGNLLSSEPGWA